MPIVIDPNTQLPPPPETVTSPDGILAARVDATWAGVLLTADFTARLAAALVGNGDFDTGIAGWAPHQVGGTVTLSQETTAPISGPGSLRCDWTAGSVSAGALTTLESPVPGGALVTMRFTARFTAAAPTLLRAAFDSGADPAFTVVDLTPAEREHVITMRVPAGQQLTRVHIYAHNGMDAAAGLILDDVNLTVHYTGVRFVRVDPDGSEFPVRSGEPAPLAGNTAVAYDHEAPLGAASAWRAELLTGDDAAAVASEQVAVAVPEPAGTPGDPGTWLKCLDDPALSLQAIVVSWTERDYTPTTDTTQVVGSDYPVVTFDTVGAATSTLTVHVRGQAGEDAIRAVVATGVFLTQSRAEYQRTDRYWVATGIKVTRTSRSVQVVSRQVALELTEVARPDTLGQPLRVPGKSYADRLRLYPTYADVPARSYADALTGT